VLHEANFSTTRSCLAIAVAVLLIIIVSLVYVESVRTAATQLMSRHLSIEPADLKVYPTVENPNDFYSRFFRKTRIEAIGQLIIGFNRASTACAPPS
jgi:hypothetical protein